MSPTTAIEPLPEELAYRSSDGLEVSLIWGQSDDSLFVVVFDAGTNTSFGLSVERGAALDAFYHPYAYAAFRGIAYQELGARGRGPLERST